MSKIPDALGTNPFQASPRTPGPLGHKDAADPSTPESFVGDTPGPLGHGDYGDPEYANAPKFSWSGQVLLASLKPTAAKQQSAEKEVVLTSKDSGWYSWAQQFAKSSSKGRAIEIFRSQAPSKAEIIRAYTAAARQAGRGMLIVSAGHGGGARSGGGAVDLAPSHKLLLSEGHFAPDPALLQAKDQAILRTFKEIGETLKKAGIAKVLFVSCYVGNSHDFLQEIADEWNVTAIGYTSLVECMTGDGKPYIFLEGNQPKTAEEKETCRHNYPPLELSKAWQIRPRPKKPSKKT
jgi:hypothetical protein